MVADDQRVVLEVLPNLEHGRIGEQGLQRGERRVDRDLAGRRPVVEETAVAGAMYQRHVAGRPGAVAG